MSFQAIHLSFQAIYLSFQAIYLSFHTIHLSFQDEIDSRDGVRLAVLAHESQDPSLAKVCARGLMQGASLEFSDTPMTVVDMMSVMFVVKYAKNLQELW